MSGRKEFCHNLVPIAVRDKPIPGHSSTSSEIILIEINVTGTRIVTSRTDRTIRIWKCILDKIIEPIVIEDAHLRAVEKISFNPKTETTFASVGRDEYLKIWKGTGTLETSVKIADSALKFVKYSPNGDHIILFDRDSRLHLLTTDDYRVISTILLPEHIYDLVWINDSSHFVCALHDGTMPVYKVTDQSITLLQTLTGHRSSITCLAIDPRGLFLSAGSNEGVVSFWDLSTMLNYKVISAIDESIACVDISRDGSFLTTAYDGGSNIRIYDSESLEEYFEVPNSLSGLFTFTKICWFPLKMSFAFSSDYGTTLTVMTKENARKQIPRKPNGL